MFNVIKKSKKTGARLGRLKTNHGVIETPFFMPVATQGAVKTASALEMEKLDAKILLANTYHLMLSPGVNMIKKIGGLHKFMDWNKPILTDSGGFQVFSLAGIKNKSGKGLVELERNGVKFKSYINGSRYYLTPEKALKLQCDLAVDIAVCLDECVALPAKREYIGKAVELTDYWARKTKKYYLKLFGAQARGALQAAPPLLFAVIQGGLDKELRLESLNGLLKTGFDGYNIGGLSVGESSGEMYGVLDFLIPEMPENKPRYLMGVGYPENIIEAVKRGVDMFDCVIPTREGRHGRLFLWNKNYKLSPLQRDSARNKYNKAAGQIINKSKIPKNFYQTINVNRSKFTNDISPINENSKLPELRRYTKAYLHHLFKIKEPLGQRLASLNNLEFYLDLLERIRAEIKNEV